MKTITDLSFSGPRRVTALEFAEAAPGSALGAKTFDETSRGEIPSWAARLDHVDLLMRLHVARRKLAAFQQSFRQYFEALHLPGRGFVFVEIPDQADANGDLVLRFAVEMATGELFAPAIAHSNFTIAHAVAIADEKVIRQAVLHVPLLPVVAVNRFQITPVRAAVMNHDVSPPARRDGSFVNGPLN